MGDDLASAVKLAEKNSSVKELKRKGFYLSSAVTFADDLTNIREWTLAYFNPETRKVFSVRVDDVIEVSDESDPLVDAYYEELDYSDMLPVKQLLAVVRERVKSEGFEPAKAVVAVREAKFSAAVFTKNLRVVRLDLGLRNAEIQHFEISNLLRTA